VDTSPISPLLLLVLIGALAVVIAGAVAVGIRIAGGRPPARRGRGSQPDDAVSGYLQAQAQAIAARLDEFTTRIGELEAGRRAESAVLQTKVDDLAASSRAVADEARAVAGAMRDNQARGLWGEMQLERVLRMSGMDEHISYETQVTVAGPDGRSRPDAIVHLPSGRCVVIDAKTPLDSYLAGASTDDPDLRSQCFADHARAVGLHVRALAARNYDEVVPGAVDVVIVFLPSDALLAEAYRSQPELLDQALAARVVLASPPARRRARLARAAPGRGGRDHCDARSGPAPTVHDLRRPPQRCRHCARPGRGRLQQDRRLARAIGAAPGPAVRGTRRRIDPDDHGRRPRGATATAAVRLIGHPVLVAAIGRVRDARSPWPQGGPGQDGARLDSPSDARRRARWASGSPCS
jgi:murein DD-endopeptidase MepM/ murein hydrolase activator NlpD